MTKTCVFLKIEKRSVLLMTSTGEFVKVKLSSKLPKIGDNYTGAILKEKKHFNQYIAAAVLLFVFLSGGGAYTYFTPVATIEMNINPSIEIKINRFNKIIRYSPLNSDGKTILEHLDIRNKNIDEALILVVDQAKKENFINANYIAQGKTISVKILSKDKSRTINLDKFEECIAQNKINTQINNNGQEKKQEFYSNEKNPAEGNNNNSVDNKSSNEQNKQDNMNDSNKKSQDKQKDKNNLNNKTNNEQTNTKNNELKGNPKIESNIMDNSTENKGEVKSDTSKLKQKP